MRWATVRISDDSGREVILTGSPSKRHFPPYHYTTTEMRGEYPGAPIQSRPPTATSASPRQPACPTPPSLTRSALPGERQRHPARTHPALHGTQRLPCVLPRVDNAPRLRRTFFCPGTLGVVEATTPGAAMSVPAMRAKSSVDTADFVPHMPAGALCGIRLERVEPEIYEFWKVFSNQALFGSSEFFDTTFSSGKCRGRLRHLVASGRRHSVYRSRIRGFSR